MFYRRETFKIRPEKVTKFNDYFNEYLVPNQIKNGAKLIGCWLTDTKNEILALWEYPSYEEFIKIEKRVLKDEKHEKAQSQLFKLGKPFLETRQDFLTSTGDYIPQKQNIAVSGYITNDKNETLLIKTYWRSDTWELPGGGIDEGETLDIALCREILEETGIEVKLDGVTGVYSNGNTVSIVFRGEYIGGNLKTSSETQYVRFVKIDSSNVLSYITRGKFIPRVLDAMKGNCIPHEAFKVRPYGLIKRLEGTLKKD
ncbi:NUDIX domain-containing protein [Alkalihalobacillus deserti]|uniref:NUDIX domain-containing protein n=1 Tax=Alkalihalobacillus deserti TaxID=2879466 RepID=UPI001D1552FD|nr:NUDIX domain-containing protein [Alkalihalobacillus deserti]